MKQQLIESDLSELLVALTSTVTTDSSSLFFSAVQREIPPAKKLVITISGVSSGAQTTVSMPDHYLILASQDQVGGREILTLSGNGVFEVFILFTGSNDTGFFEGQLIISGNEINTKIVNLAGSVTPNPSIFPSSLFFSTIEEQTPPPLELTITVSNVSSLAQTFLQTPDFYQVSNTPDGTVLKSLAFTGNGVFKAFIHFVGNTIAGIFNGVINVTGDEIIAKTIPLKTTVLVTPTPNANPGSLSGFTAIENGVPSAIQSFNLTVNGLPTQGKPVITVTAPKGYSVGLSSNPSSFVGAFVVFAQNGNINTKVFVRLNSNNPVGAVNGAVTISGTQINTKTVPVSGTITAKPQPTITVDKTSLTGFTTTTNKASAAQSYHLQAANLDAGVAATVKAPAGYEVSLTNLSNSIFQSQLTVLQVTAGTINATIFVRLKSQSIAGNVTGVIENSVAGLIKDVNVSGTVVPPPTVTINPAVLTGFSTVQNQASASKTYSFVASNLAAGASATITAPANFELRIQGVGTFSSNLTLAQNGTGSINRVIEVRLKAIATAGTFSGSIQHTINGITKFVSVSGSVAAPTLSTTASSFTFSTVENQASAPKSYNVVAFNLASGLTATVTASSSYEISLKSDGVFTSSLTLLQNVSQGINTQVFVRMKASAATGSIAGTLQHSVAGLNKVITLSGTVAAPVLTVNPISLTGFSTARNQPSATKSYNLVASNLANGVTAVVTAPAGYELSVQGTTTFSSSLTLKQTTTGVISVAILVRLKAQATAGSISGNITNIVEGINKTVVVSGVVS
jgi:hypothetical protein